MRIAYVMLTTAALLNGCASSHDLKSPNINPFGGGFLDYKIRDGMFEIIARTNSAPWLNIAAAKKTWQGRADTLCGQDQYREFDIQEGDAERLTTGTPVNVPSVGWAFIPGTITTIRRGFAVCNSANMSDEDVRAALRKRARGLVFDIPATPETEPEPKPK